MTRVILYITFVFLLVSCSSADEKVPSDVIPKEEFTDLLLEVQLMESYCQVKYVREDVYKKLIYDSVDSLMKANERTLEEYDRSFDYYSKQPSVMFKIYEEVLNRMNQLQVKNTTVKKEESD